MGKGKTYGICHICGQTGELSYEHIPPKSAFNSTKRKLCSMETLLETPSRDNIPPWDLTGLKYTQFQQGVGFPTLCEKCNNFTGHNYGGEYKKFVQGIGYQVMQIPKENRHGAVSFHVQDINMLFAFKQIISMFCSINTPEFGQNFRDFLLNVDSTNFDCNKFKVCTYLHSGKVDRLVPVQGSLDTRTGNMMLFSEISTIPLGFIFFYVEEGRLNTFCGCDITSLANRNGIREMDLTIPFYPCNTPFGLDFRDL